MLLVSSGQSGFNKSPILEYHCCQAFYPGEGLIEGRDHPQTSINPRWHGLTIYRARLGTIYIP